MPETEYCDCQACESTGQRIPLDAAGNPTLPHGDCDCADCLQAIRQHDECDEVSGCCEEHGCNCGEDEDQS
jgi:hypothetical protein